MTKHLLRHLKQNTIAYFALFVALGGTSYASVQQVGATHVTRSAKAGITCGGACPASYVYWAYVGAKGLPSASAPGNSAVYQTAIAGVPATVVHQGLGDFLVFFAGKELTNCARFANLVHDRGSATVSGYDRFNADPQGIHVLTTDASGNPADADFVVLALCGKTNGLTVTPAAPAAGAH